MKNEEIIAHLSESIAVAKSSLEASEKWLLKLSDAMGIESDKLQILASHKTLTPQADDKVVEGIFDGQNMIDEDGTIYPVPANYASKSKLIEGDRLKLSVADNGAFIYKQIELIPRKLLIGHLVLDDSQYQVLADGVTFNVIYASVTFFRANVGDKVTIIVPEVGSSKWAAIENIIPQD